VSGMGAPAAGHAVLTTRAAAARHALVRIRSV
jgi:hypothetical protein